jgi:hypothetical protein
MFNRLLDPEGYKLPRLAQLGPQIGAEVQRLQALTLPQLATEVMTKAFTPGYTPGDGYTGLGAIADNFLPDYGAPRAGDTTTPEEYALCDLLAEGIQLLEQACRAWWNGSWPSPAGRSSAVARSGTGMLRSRP